MMNNKHIKYLKHEKLNDMNKLFILILKKTLENFFLLNIKRGL